MFTYIVLALLGLGVFLFALRYFINKAIDKRISDLIIKVEKGQYDEIIHRAIKREYERQFYSKFNSRQEHSGDAMDHVDTVRI